MMTAVTTINGKCEFTPMMQSNGEFVVYRTNKPAFRTSTGYANGAYITMQDDRNLVVYDS